MLQVKKYAHIRSPFFFVPFKLPKVDTMHSLQTDESQWIVNKMYGTCDDIEDKIPRKILPDFCYCIFLSIRFFVMLLALSPNTRRLTSAKCILLEKPAPVMDIPDRILVYTCRYLLSGISIA